MITFKRILWSLLITVICIESIFTYAYFKFPKEKIVYKDRWHPHPSAPDSITTNLPIINIPKPKPPKPSVQIVNIPSDTTKPSPMGLAVENLPTPSYTSHKTFYHPTFLGTLISDIDAKAPCKVTLFDNKVWFQEGDDVVRKNFEKQITDRFKKEHPGKFWTGVAVGSAGTAIIITAIIISKVIK
jgi:hypothetical protein